MFQPSRAAGGGRGAGGSGSLRRRRREALQRRRSETGTSYKHGAARGGNSAYKKGLWALEDLEHGDGRFGHEFGGDGVALHRKRNATGARWSCVAATARKSAYKNSLWDDEDLEDEQSDEEEGETRHRVRRQSKGYGAHRKHQEAGAVKIDYMRSLREVEDFEDEQFDDEGFDDEYLW
ncbi:hypothetical protein MPH_12649 [Macrophomina phaseolina MS6]|uniref:Uncharacterized protein n=1 Tax=Macrophomina phaseolina (strain MS6) TaxID=1126212 RepID=K2RBK3_MACPH|nr:hypothetical protein MPH_12649 [Macrophomina phaseolina MS6]